MDDDRRSPIIIHIQIPRFWIALEERRRPELSGRPVIIGNGLLEKTAARGAVSMANAAAESFGVQAGMSLAHARQRCPEALVLPPELPLYVGVWDEIMDLLLTYTPFVEALDPGEAVGDVSGCERLFGDPVDLAGEMTAQIGRFTGLIAHAGVGSNRLVAQLAAKLVSDNAAGEEILSSPLEPDRQVGVVQPGQEAAFLAPLPVTSLPEIDPDMLLNFQVLGLKTIGHLTLIPESAFERRFGPRGGRLAQYARGRDDRRVCPGPPVPAVKVSRRCDDVDWLEPRQALTELVERLAVDLSDRLSQQRLAGRLLALLLRTPRRSPEFTPVSPTHPTNWRASSHASMQAERIFLGRDARIHSMLPQPRMVDGPGRGLPGVPASPRMTPGSEREAGLLEPEGYRPDSQPGMVVRGLARMTTQRPLNDERNLSELAGQLLARLLSTVENKDVLAAPGLELQLEMRHFAPPEQLTLLDPNGLPLGGRPVDARLERLRRQEAILVSRFGSSPFRHLADVNIDSVLSERICRWGGGMAR